MTGDKMEAIALGGNTNTAGTAMVEKPSPFNDGRFSELARMVVDLKNLNRELNEMITHKADALLGDLPCAPTDDVNKEASPNGWIEEVMFETRVATKFCRDSLEKFSVV